MTNINGFFTDVTEHYPDYLRDESRRTGTAESISFPKSEDELRVQLAELYKNKTPITLQGARTGITGGAVPNGGHILNLNRMNHIMGILPHPSEDAFILTVQPGVLLADLRLLLENRNFDTTSWSQESLKTLADFTTKKGYFFPPDPTEASASIGGMVSCNASGARSFFYGPTRDYVETLRVVLSDGSVINLKRGEQKTSGRSFSAITSTGRKISGSLPEYNMPKVKNASGYFVYDNMDLLDLFIGAEGTLGVISEIGIKLVPCPPVIWGVMAFLPSEEIALNFVKTVRSAEEKPIALEFFNHGSLDLLRKQKESNPAFKDIATMPPAFHTGVYLEYHGPDEETVENTVMNMSEIMTTAGGDTDATWMASDKHCMEQLKNFRHALPEAVNLQIDEKRKKEPTLTKLGTDLAVPDDKLEEIINIYNRDLTEAGLNYVIFGHIGNNHVHVNIIPNTPEEYQRGKNLYLKWAAQVVAMGGSVSAEHGIGKLKTEMLKTMFGEEGIKQMKETRNYFNPDNLLNRGNLFSA
ncbi:MAG: FAD-binding oxidoreductase [Kiritimatiellae bacterium]|nr:FAD-binding oxidoreductase [Kiritimatiellia bacterium]MDD5519985.1 FAD-binding oxidoreductase [Kiritimatiellia bacterium]